MEEESNDKVREKIDEILKGKDMGEDPVPLNLDPDVVERLSARDKMHAGQGLPDSEEEEEEAPAIPPDTGRESNFFKNEDPEVSGLKAWAMQMPDLPKEYVEPSEMDKRLYMKSMLNDVPLELTIRIPAIDLHMTIRSLNNFEQNIIFQALELDQKDGNVAGPTQYMTWVQYYAAALQLVEFNGKRQEYIEFDTDNLPPPEEAVAKLRAATMDQVAKNNWPTWQVKMTGLRIFEIKLGLCNRAVFERNFWNPADPD